MRVIRNVGSFDDNTSWWWLGVYLYVGGALATHSGFVGLDLGPETEFISYIVDVTEDTVGIGVTIAATDGAIVVGGFLAVHDGAVFVSALVTEIVGLGLGFFLRRIEKVHEYYS